MNQGTQTRLDMEPAALRQNLPGSPGVYMFKDSSHKIIYIGKAKNLKKRVLSYFKKPSDLTYKTGLLMSRAKNLDYLITSTENEAFILENSLIKKHMPRYNIILRDDKQYPSIRLSIKDKYPRLNIVRRIKKDGAVYFGPFSSAYSVRNTLKLIEKIFRLRKCKGPGLPKRSRPCLNFQLGRCLGPCTKNIPESDYGEIVNQVRLFLEGRNTELLKQLKKEMKAFSDQLNFEEAANIRDQINAVKKTIERQHVVSPGLEDQDIIGIAKQKGRFQLVLLFVRKGYLLGSRDFRFKDEGESSSEIIEAFIKQHYQKETFIPKRILISRPVNELKSISQWLSGAAGEKITIHHPVRGEKLRYIRMAVSNAEDLLSRKEVKEQEDLIELTKSALRLTKFPRNIEGLDISNIQGQMAVGTIVSFKDGLPFKSGYRNYKIKNIDQIDDYGMMCELARRRLSKDNLPDLFLVDGGKGHLQAVKKVMDEFLDKDLPEIAAIAKADDNHPDSADKIYIFGRKNPISLRKDHPVLFFLMRIRDESHRRAIGYHRKLRSKGLIKSRLDIIPGIGPKRKKRLLQHFGDIRAISRATTEDLMLVSGISPGLAEEIFRTLSKMPQSSDIHE